MSQALHTHILIHCPSERIAETVFAICDGDVRCIVVDNKWSITAYLPSYMLESMTVRRVAPKVIRLDKRGNADIDFAHLRQLFAINWRLIREWHWFEERDGLSS